MTKDTRNTYERITDAMIAAMEKADLGEWQMPWHRMSSLPRNVSTGLEYQGANITALWAAGYSSSEWATYKQWEALGAKVRKGEKGTVGIKWLPVQDKMAKPRLAADGATITSNFMMPWGFVVFNAEQVDGYVSKAVPLVDLTERVATADAVIEKSGAVIKEGGSQAFYRPKDDIIGMPARVLFKETKTSTATECYYSTKLHELVHWTGADKRLGRKLVSMMDRDSYAFEELVAELGAAFLCAKLGISNDPRPDHAQYLKCWLSRLKSDPKALVRAASLAQKAVNFLLPKEEASAEPMKEAA
jgi:antirestriction protein ArdC